MFASPPRADLEQSDSGVEGLNRFLRRLWSISYAQRDTVAQAHRRRRLDRRPAAVKDLRREVYNLLKQADYDYQRIQYNTVVAGADEDAQRHRRRQFPLRRRHADAAYAEIAGVLLRVLYPVVPHITWHLWRDLGYANELATCSTRPGRTSTRRSRWWRTNN